MMGLHLILIAGTTSMRDMQYSIFPGYNTTISDRLIYEGNKANLGHTVPTPHPTAGLTLRETAKGGKAVCTSRQNFLLSWKSCLCACHKRSWVRVHQRLFPCHCVNGYKLRKYCILWLSCVSHCKHLLRKACSFIHVGISIYLHDWYPSQIGRW